MHILLFGGRNERLELRLHRSGRSLDGLLALLTHTFGGGTDFDAPLLRAVELLDEHQLAAADILVVTDGMGRAAPSVLQSLEAARQRHGLRIFGVVAAHHPGGVDAFADHIWLLNQTDHATELFVALRQ
jgi:uncharacterized protein with von Willebrand factor type A (vWA) domain